MILEVSDVSEYISLLVTLTMYIRMTPFLAFFSGGVHKTNICLGLKMRIETFAGGSIGAAKKVVGHAGEKPSFQLTGFRHLHSYFTTERSDVNCYSSYTNGIISIWLKISRNMIQMLRR